MPHDLQDPQRVLTKSPRLGLFSPEAFAITDENVLLMLGDADNNEGLPPNSCSARVLRAIKAMVKSVNDNTIVFFAKNADMVTLNKVSLRYWELFAKNAGLLQDCVYWTQAIVYIRDNEQCSRICVVHFVDDREAVQSISAKQEASKKAPSDAAAAADSAGEPSAAQAAQAPIGICAPQMDQDPQSAIQLLARELPPMPAEAWLLMDNVALIDTVYPQFQIDCIVVRGSCFSPPAILWLASESIICIEFCMCSPFTRLFAAAEHLHIEPNYCFMAMPDTRFGHRIGSLGGVRLITQSDSHDQRNRNLARTRAVLSRVAEDILAHEAAREDDEEQELSGGAAGAVAPRSPSRLPSPRRRLVAGAALAVCDPPSAAPVDALVDVVVEGSEGPSGVFPASETAQAVVNVQAAAEHFDAAVPSVAAPSDEVPAAVADRAASVSAAN